MSWLTSPTIFDPLIYYTAGCRTVAEIQNKIMKKSGRNRVSRIWHAMNDKEAISGWRGELNEILFVFNVRPLCSVRYSLTALPPDRVDYEQSHHDRRYASEHVKNSQGSRQPRLVCECRLHCFRCRTETDHLTGSNQVSDFGYQEI